MSTDGRAPVYYAGSSRHRPRVYHTAPDCPRVEAMTNRRRMAVEDVPADWECCRECAGESDRPASYDTSHYQALVRAAVGPDGGDR